MNLTLGHRPKWKQIPAMADDYDIVVVLLKDSEGVQTMLTKYREAGLIPLHVPFTVKELIKSPDEECAEVRKMVASIAKLLIFTDCRVFVHCSAGIHRTGCFAYAVLRCLGLDPQEAVEVIRELRPVTATGFLPFRQWAEDNLLPRGGE